MDLFEGAPQQRRVRRNSGGCSGDWPAEDECTIDEKVTGRLMCVETTLVTALYWTDDRLNIRAWAASSEKDRKALREFWRTKAGRSSSSAGRRRPLRSAGRRRTG